MGHPAPGVEGEVVGAAGPLDDLAQYVFGVRGLEVRKTMMTTEDDEVELACVLPAF